MRAFYIALAVGAAAFASESAFAQPAPQPPIAGPPPAGGQTVIVVQGAPPPRREVVIVEDGPRFRGGVSLDGGVFALPSQAVNFGVIGLQGHIGAQINDLFGIYADPYFDIAFGDAIGGDAFLAIMPDFTFASRFTVGVGPTFGIFGAGGISGNAAFAAGGLGAGARVHLAAYPVVGRSHVSPQRRAFSIGLDTDLLAENGAAAATNCTTGQTNCGTSASVGYGIALHAMLTLGYEAF